MAEGDWPLVSTIKEAFERITGGGSTATATEEQPAAEAGAASTATTEAAATGSGEAAAVETPATTTATSPGAATTDAPLAERIKADPRAFIESLPEDVRTVFGTELYKNMQRTLETERRQTQRTVGQAVAQVRTEFEKQLDELRTANMDEDEKAAYFRDKDAAAYRAEQERRAEAAKQPAVDNEKLEQAWQRIERAGLPRNPDDPYVKMLDLAWDTNDFGVAMQRLDASITKAVAQRDRDKANGGPRPTIADEAKREIDRLVAEGIEKGLPTAVSKQLRDLGYLTTDTGRSGGSTSTTEKPKTKEERISAVARKITEGQR